MGGVIKAYNLAGRLQFTIDFTRAITAMTEVIQRDKNFLGYAVALANGEVKIYSGKHLASVLKLNVCKTKLLYILKAYNYYFIIIFMDF